MKSRLGDFDILDRIDPGGYTVVYRAWQDMGQSVRRPAAIKILQGWNLDDERQVQDLVREVELLVEMSSSPNIVTVYGFGIDDEIGPWLAMELGGRSLKHYIREEPTDPEQVRLLLRDILRALSSVHGVTPPILHRDIKPNNILSSQFGIWKLADFGLATRQDSDSTLHLATVQYAAPEMLDGSLGAETPKMDLYSLGMVAYHYALGESLYRKQFPSIFDPYAGQDDDPTRDDRPKWMYWHTSAQMTVQPLADIIEGYPKDLSDLIASMIRKDPADRIASASEALQRLGNVDSQIAVPIVKADDQESSSGLRTLSLALVAVVLLLVVSVALFLHIGTGPTPVIRVADDGVISTREPNLTLTGRISNFPSSGSASVSLRNLAPIPVTVDSQGVFTSQVPLARLGQIDGQLVVFRSGRDEPVARHALRLDREPPEQVQLGISTRPPAIGATIEIRERDRNRPPIRLTTNSEGMAASPVAYGQIDISVMHPGFREMQVTRSTGHNPQNQLLLDLTPLSEQAIDQRREVLLTELEALSDRVQRGDPVAIARMAEIQRELGLLEPMTGDAAAARRVALQRELADVIERAKSGDPDAIRRQREIIAELRELAGTPGTRTADDGRQRPIPADPVRDRAERRAALIREMGDLAARAEAGDPAAIARLREIRTQLAEIEGEVEDNSAIGRRRRELLDEMSLVAELAAAGDPGAQARLAAIHRELATLSTIEQGAGDPTQMAAAAQRMLGDTPDLSMIDRAVLMQLPLEQFRAFIELNIPSGSLIAETVPHSTRVRVRGVLFNDAEMERIMARLEPAKPRLVTEIRVDPWAVCRRLQRALESMGAEDVIVHAHLTLGDNLLFVVFRRQDGIDETRVRQTTHQFVIDRDLIVVTTTSAVSARSE